MDEEKSGSSTLQKKAICYTVGLAVRIFPATMRTFTKDTALLEQGRARHGMCELTHGMAWAWHALCESTLRGVKVVMALINLSLGKTFFIYLVGRSFATEGFGMKHSRYR